MSKKFVLFLLCAFLFSFSSCQNNMNDISSSNNENVSDNSSVYNSDTAKKIEFKSKEAIYHSLDLNRWTCLYSSSNRAIDDGIDIFEEFRQYYKDYKFSSNTTHCLLKPGDNELGWGSHNLLKEFYIYESVDNEFIVEENLYFNLDEFSSAYENDESNELDGKVKWNLHLNIYLATIEKDINSNDYILEFGITKAQETYVNIYIDSHCIGTCFYDCKAEITQTWFEIYFKQNLMKE